MQLPGIYVEIKGDYSDLQKKLRAAKELVAQQATGISNALNNALSPEKVKSSINALVGNFSALNRASSVAGQAFDNIAADLGDLRKTTGLTEQQFAKLQAQLLKTQASNAQEAALKRIAAACNLTEKEIRELGVQFGLSADQIKKVVGSTKAVESSLGSLGSIAKGALAYFSFQQLAAFGKSALDAGIQVDSLNRSLVAISGSQSAAAQEMAFLKQTADATGQNLFDLDDGLKKLAASTQGTALEGQKTKDVFSSIAEASAVLGMSAEQTKLSLNALAQMASKGTVSAEELKGQLGDALPGALNIAARAMGKSTAELMKMMENGELLAVDLLPKLAQELHNLYREASQTAALESGQAAVNKLSEAWTAFKSNIYESTKNVILPSIRSVTEALNDLAGVKNKGDAATTAAIEGGYLKVQERLIQLKKERESLNEGSSASRRQEINDEIRRLELAVSQAKELKNAGFGKDGELTIRPEGVKKQIYDPKKLEDGRKKLAEYIQTREEKIKQDYEEAVRYAQSSEEIAKAAKVRDAALRAIADKQNKASGSAAAKAERELNQEIAAGLKFREAQSELSDNVFAKELAKIDEEKHKFITSWADKAKSAEEYQNRITEISKWYSDARGKVEREQAQKAADERKSMLETEINLQEALLAQRKAEGAVSSIDALKEEFDLAKKRQTVLAEYLQQMDKFKDVSAYNSQAEALARVNVELAQLGQQLRLTDTFEAVKKGLKDVSDNAIQTGEDIRRGIVSAFDSVADAIAQFVTGAKIDITNLVNSIIADFARIAIQKSITGPLASGLGSVIGGLFGGGGGSTISSNFSLEALGFHNSGIVGVDAPTFSRSVPSSTFAGARRYHSGLMPDEFPAILQRGEGVFTKAQMAAMGEAQRSNVVVNVIESPGKGGQQQQRKVNGVNVIDVFVESIKASIASDISVGGGAVPTALANAYGLNRVTR